MRKTRKSVSLPLSVKLPPKRVREKFLIIYEVEGCQKGVDFLTEFYEIRRMRIFLDGKKVGKNFLACYLKNTAYLTKKDLNRRIFLHEFYHHLAEVKRLEMPLRTEEKEANNYAKRVVRSKWRSL